MKLMTEPAWCVCVGGGGVRVDQEGQQSWQFGECGDSFQSSICGSKGEACEAAEVRLLSKEWL